MLRVTALNESSAEVLVKILSDYFDQRNEIKRGHTYYFGLSAGFVHESEEFHFPGLESHGIQLLVLESHGKLTLC